MKFKKFAALFCAAVCAMTTVASAAPSIKELAPTPNRERNAAITAGTGYEIIVSKIDTTTLETTQEYAKKTFKESEDLTAEKIAKIAEGLKKVNDPKSNDNKEISPVEFMKDFAGVPAETKTMKCENSDREVVLDNLHFMAPFSNIGLTKDGGATIRVLDENGENYKMDAVLNIDQIKSEDDLKGAVIMVLDPKTGEPKLIDLEVVKVDTKTMDLTIPFPCFGPFAPAQEAQPEA